MSAHMLSDMVHMNWYCLADAVKTVDSVGEVTQQSFHSEIAQPSFLFASTLSDVKDVLENIPKPSGNFLKAAEKDLGLLNTEGEELKEIKASINTLNYAVAATFSATFSATAASWFDLKQDVAGLLNEQQERALPDVTTKLTVHAGNIAFIELSAPKRLRGFHEKSFTLKPKDEGKVIELVYFHEGNVQAWQQHLPGNKIVDLEQQKTGLIYTFHKVETATNSGRAQLRIKLTQPLARPSPWRLLA